MLISRFRSVAETEIFSSEKITHIATGECEGTKLREVRRYLLGAVAARKGIPKILPKSENKWGHAHIPHCTEFCADRNGNDGM